MNELNQLPDYYSFENREKIQELTALLSGTDRNKLINQRCTVLEYNLRKYTSGNRNQAMSLMKDEMRYLQSIKGNENIFLENQIRRLKFEMTLLEEVSVNLRDPIGIKIALDSIRTVIDRIMEEVDSMNE